MNALIAFLAAQVLGSAAQATTLPALPEDASVVERALYAEMTRATEQLFLPGSELPYFVQCDLLEGRTVRVRQRFGTVVDFSDRPVVTARIEVRIGDYAFDSADFDGQAFGVVMLSLPEDGDEVAYRRKFWLAFDRAYKDALEGFAEKKASRKSDDRVHPPALLPQAPFVRTLEKPVAFDLDVNALAAILEPVGAVSDGYEGLERFEVRARDTVGTHLTLNSEALWVEREFGRSLVTFEALSRLEDGTTLETSSAWHGSTLDSLPPGEEIAAEMRSLLDTLQERSEAPVLAEYVGPVLFEGQAAVELFRQLLHPPILGTPPSEEPFRGRKAADMPRASGRLGRRLLPAGWTVVDSTPDHPEAMGHYRYDDDGIAPQRVVLVEDGYVRRLLRSRIPDLDQAPSTGHGRTIGTGRRSATPGVIEVLPGRAVSSRKLRRLAVREAAKAGRSGVLVIRKLEPFSLADDFRLFFTGSGAPAGLTEPLEAVLRYADGREEPVRGLSFVGVDARVLRDLAASGEAGEFFDLHDGGTGSSRHIEASGGHSVTWRAPDVLVGEVELRGDSGGESRVLGADTAGSTDL